METGLAKAAKGGQVGINGEWYKGGQFLPLTIFCDKWANGCLRGRTKSAKMMRLAKSSTYCAIVKVDGTVYARACNDETAAELYAEAVKHDYEWYSAGKLIQHNADL